MAMNTNACARGRTIARERQGATIHYGDGAAVTKLDLTPRRTASAKIRLSWTKPHDSVTLQFGSESVAKRVSGKFKSGKYRIGDSQQQIATAPQKGDRGMWTITLTRVPSNTSQAIVKSAITADYDQPRAVFVTSAQDYADVNSARLELQRLLDPVYMTRTLSGPSSTSVIVFATLQSDQAARLAVEHFHDKPQKFLRGHKLAVQQVHSLTLRTSSRLYKLLEGNIAPLESGWQRQGLRLTTRNNDPNNPFTTLTLEGTQIPHLAEATDALEEILRGYLVGDAQGPYWATEFAGSGRSELRALERTYRVIVEANAGKRELRCWGTHFQIIKVTSAVQKLVEEWYKPSSAISNEQSTPQPQYCPICYDGCETPVKLSCGHVHCKGCFEDLCGSVDGISTNFSINCASCADPICLSDLQHNLPKHAFQSVLERSYNAYLRRHPNELCQCPTPDCGYLFQPTNDATTRTCGGCFSAICTSCRARHWPVRCEDVSVDEAFENFSRTYGIKKCSKCSASVEKIEGCNRIPCICGAQLCWLCMANFEDDGDCYAHLDEVHGGHD